MTWLVPALACALALLVAPSRRPLLPWLLPAGVLGVGALRLARVDQFFACVAAALLAQALAARAIPETGEPTEDQAGRWAVAAIVMIVILGPRAAAIGSNVRCIPVDREFAETGALRSLALVPAGARVLTFFDYGEFAIWHLAPRLRVSMDGRRETVYSPETIAAHTAFYDDPSQHRGYPDGIGAGYVWVPSEPRFRSALSSAGWTPIFTGPVSTVWSRRTPRPLDGEPTKRGDVEPLSTPRCFPDGMSE